MEYSKTPCHECTAYDFGTSDKPSQRCRAHKRELTMDEACQGCEKFRKRRRFDLESQFEKKGWRVDVRH